MTVANRPTQITKILKNLNSLNDEFYADAERYITELESKQSDRPVSIVKFLKRMIKQPHMIQKIHPIGHMRVLNNVPIVVGNVK